VHDSGRAEAGVRAFRARDAGRALVVTNLNPVVALALGVGLLGERPGAGAVAGLALILAGAWFATDGRLPKLASRSTPATA